jgi:alpha-ketoglutarate-dependent taurine dioxygenase
VKGSFKNPEKHWREPWDSSKEEAMTTLASKPSLGKISAIQPRKVMAGQSLVHESPLLPGQEFPMVLEPSIAGVDLLAWARESRGFVERKLLERGGILFRGFGLQSPATFEEFINIVSGEALEYRERSSPRNTVAGNIYTSTEHPPDQPIFLHNENSYAGTWPLKIFFSCVTAAQQGGETPICDVRRVYQRIPGDVRERFEQKGVMYVRNFSDHIGLSWKTVFQTEDRTKVELYCRNAGYQFEWRDSGRLRTRRIAPAVATHPQTGEKIWFNHAAFFHVSTLEPAVRDSLRAQFADEDLPNHTYYGDGSPIEDAALDAIREAYYAETMKFPWRPGDVLALDNMLAAHGRMPYVGPRKILVGMATPHSKHN